MICFPFCKKTMTIIFYFQSGKIQSFVVDKDIKIGQLMYNIFFKNIYPQIFNSPMDQYAFIINGKLLNNLRPIDKIETYEKRGKISIYVDFFIYSSKPFIKELEVERNKMYFETIKNYGENRIDFACLNHNQYLLYEDYIKEAQKLYQGIDKKKYINGEDPISFNEYNEVKDDNKIFWQQNNKTFWMEKDSLKKYIQTFKTYDEKGAEQIISPFYDSPIVEPWRTDFLYMVKSQLC